MELEMQKKKYGDEDGSEADLVEELVTFFARRGGRTTSGKFLSLLSLLFFLTLSMASGLEG